jgi:hypothetical protein
MKSTETKNYLTIAELARSKSPLHLVLGDGNAYKAVYKPKNEPKDDDIIGWFDKNDEFCIGYIVDIEWDHIAQIWEHKVVCLLPLAARVTLRRVVGRTPIVVFEDEIHCVLRLKKKAKKK